MAIIQVSAQLIAGWVFDYGIGGACLEIARQDVRLTVKQFDSLLENLAKESRNRAEKVGLARRKLKDATANGAGLAERRDLHQQGYISDQLFFDVLGFDHVASVDASEFEGADIVYDLNQDGLVDCLDRQYELAIETGTAEHVFHIPNYLKNIVNSLNVGGCAIHFVPANNYLDHGFYQFSPTLFYDYYSANQFTIMKFLILETETLDWLNPKIYEYVPGAYDSLERDRFSGNFVVLAIVARKEADSTSTKMPQQRIYARSMNWMTKLEGVEPDQLPLIATLTGPFSHVSDHCWEIALPLTVGDTSADPYKSSLVLLEDGKLIGEAHALHAKIAEMGKGLYSHWGEHLYFSTSDNTDPNINKRCYEVRQLD